MEKAAVLLSAVVAAMSLTAEETALKTAFDGKFWVGAALNERQIMGRNPEERKLIADQFNSITAENCMKPGSLQPREGEFNWRMADRFVDFGVENKMKVIGHCLVWHSQLPRWMNEKLKGQCTRDEAVDIMKRHVQTVVGHFKGRVKGWDVVNEAIEENGSLRRTVWLNTIGEDYLLLAFRFAHDADPEAELYYNEYNTENPRKADRMVKLVKDLRAAGLRIDALGMQTHVRLDHPRLGAYAASMRKFAEAGVKLMVTELDVSVLPAAWRMSADVSRNIAYDAKLNPWPDGKLPESVQKRLSDRYAELFRLFLEYSSSLDRVTFWGVSDRDSWLNNFPVRGRTDYPLPFDRSLHPKPLVKTIEELL